LIVKSRIQLSSILATDHPVNRTSSNCHPICTETKLWWSRLLNLQLMKRRKSSLKCRQRCI